MDNKFRILYNEEMVIDVLEDYGTTFIGNESGIMVLVDTKENAKTMLEAIGVDTGRLFDPGYRTLPEPPTGIDYLDSLNNSVDPNNLIEGGII